MELLCCETQPEFAVTSHLDRTVLEDDRVIANLLHLEPHFVIRESYFETFQDEIKPEMRRILITWMSEVCEDQCCEDVVLPLATNILDRFLICVRIKKSQLQLLGSVCLLISSKIRQCRALTGELLCFYTDNSITLKELIDWELLVLSKLHWNTSAVTANDFINPLIARIPQVKDMDKIRQHANIFISLCSTELQFSLYKPSLIAVASLCVAALGLNVKCNVMDSMRSIMQRIVHQPAATVSTCIVQIEELFSFKLASIHQMALSNAKRPAHSGNKASSGLAPDDLCQPETPTDVQDIYF